MKDFSAHQHRGRNEGTLSRGSIEVWGAVFATARTPGAVEVDTETHTVAWPGGADLAPDTLHERVRTGAWPKGTASIR